MSTQKMYAIAGRPGGTTFTHKKIPMESQAKLINLVTSYSPDIWNIPKKSKHKKSYDLKGNS